MPPPNFVRRNSINLGAHCSQLAGQSIRRPARKCRASVCRLRTSGRRRRIDFPLASNVSSRPAARPLRCRLVRLILDVYSAARRALKSGPSRKRRRADADASAPFFNHSSVSIFARNTFEFKSPAPLETLSAGVERSKCETLRYRVDALEMAASLLLRCQSWRRWALFSGNSRRKSPPRAGRVDEMRHWRSGPRRQWPPL